MPDPGFSYSEDILQWIWEEQLFDIRKLETSDGKPVQILNPGVLNKTDGPDFLNARIRIEGVLWVGAVELHLQSKGWELHGHHNDEAYNQVILHVVAENQPKTIKRKDGGSVPTLNILPQLPGDLNRFVENMSTSNQLPCTSGINYISEQVFLEQIQKAHNEYLEKKANDFLSFYNPDAAPSKAWKEALILSAFDGFGITHNREPMIEVGRWLLKQGVGNFSESKLIEGALSFAGFGAESPTLNWNCKGVFPASHPKLRIPQAVRLAIQIQETPLELFLSEQGMSLWNKWQVKLQLTGSKKFNVLYGITFIPAMFTLGNLFAAHKISQKALEEWHHFRAPVPVAFTKYFMAHKNISPGLYIHKLGAVHQYRYYCRHRRCHQCFVLKKVISS